MNFLIRITILAILLPTLSFATDKLNCDGHGEPENTSAVEIFCHDLSHLLPQEMQALQSGMMSVIPAYVSGSWSEIEATAAKMKKCVSLASCPRELNCRPYRAA